MNHPLALMLEKPAFLQWAQGREGHFELKGNCVVMMTGGTKGHARLIQRIALALATRLDSSVWSVTANDLAVEIGEDIRYPDIIVEPMDAANSALSTSTPVFVAEVLSPSSLALDLNIKTTEYMSLNCLEAYLVAAQDEMRMWLWQRPASGSQRPFPAAPVELFGPNAELALHILGINIPLAEIYASIVPPR